MWRTSIAEIAATHSQNARRVPGLPSFVALMLESRVNGQLFRLPTDQKEAHQRNDEFKNTPQLMRG